METTYRKASQWANQHRPHVEQRARSSPGLYLVNLTHEWCLLLKSIL